MKTTTAKATINLVNNLADLIEQRRHLEKMERSLKDSLKSLMAESETSVLSAGEYVVILSTRQRSSLDDVLVKSLLGDRYAECVKSADYQILEIKKA